MTYLGQITLLARVSVGVYLLAVLAIALGDLASFLRLSAVAVAFSVEVVVRLLLEPELVPPEEVNDERTP